MPFGKHKGRPLAEVPADYLRWCLDDCDFVRKRPSLRDLLVREWQRRINPPPPPAPEPDTELRPVLQEFVRAGFRALVRQYHPDHGGAHADMVRVNAHAETLRRKGWL